MNKFILPIMAIGLVTVAVASMFRYATVVAPNGATIITDRFTGRVSYCIGAEGCAPMGQKLPGPPPPDCSTLLEYVYGKGAVDYAPRPGDPYYDVGRDFARLVPPSDRLLDCIRAYADGRKIAYSTAEKMLNPPPPSAAEKAAQWNMINQSERDCSKKSQAAQTALRALEVFFIDH